MYSTGEGDRAGKETTAGGLLQFGIRLGDCFSRKVGSSGDLQLTYLFSLARVFIY